MTNPAYGSVTLNSDGSFTYMPNGTFVGYDSFTYMANDGSLNSNVATATIGVTDQVPVANNGEYDAPHGQDIDVPASSGVLSLSSDPDGDPLIPVIDFPAVQGKLTPSMSYVFDPASNSEVLRWDGGFIYDPNSNYAGTDSFSYHVSDGVLASNSATITLRYTDTAPAVTDESYGVFENHVLTVAAAGLLSGASDIDAGDHLVVSLHGQAANGQAVVNSDGSFSYTPNAGFVGTDSFSFDVTDGAAHDCERPPISPCRAPSRGQSETRTRWPMISR